MRQSQLPTRVCVCPSCPPHTHTHTYSWPHKLTQVLKARRRTPPSHTHTHTHTGKLIYLRQQFSTHICKFRKCFIWGLATHTCMGAEGGEMGAWKGKGKGEGDICLVIVLAAAAAAPLCKSLGRLWPLLDLCFPFTYHPSPFPLPYSPLPLAPLLTPVHVH